MTNIANKERKRESGYFCIDSNGKRIKIAGGGVNLSTGGTAGQVLIKASDADFDTAWADTVPASNPNLLDNWYFADPINQRRQNSYIGGYKTYTIDRWFNTADSATTTVEAGFIKVADTQGNCQFRQAIERNDRISGNTVTVSFLAKRGTSGNADFGFYQNVGGEMLYDPSKIVSMDDTIQLISVTGVIPTVANSIEIGVYITAGANSVINLYAAKLELSDRQTLAHQDADGNWGLIDPPPNKSLEMLKCQKHQVHAAGTYKNSTNSNGYILDVEVPLSVPIRTTPMGKSPALSYIYHDGNSYDASNFTYNQILYGGATNLIVRFNCKTALNGKKVGSNNLEIILDANL